MEISDLLTEMVKNKASDLFLSVDSPPLIKVEGKMRPVGTDTLDTETNHRLILSILTDNEAAEFDRDAEMNKSLHAPGVGRFRVNVFRQRGEPALVARHIKDKIPSIEQLQLPEVLQEYIMAERGLILVVGGTGTGKSTTLAAMIDYRNANRDGHILTIEDPIEFVYRHRKSLVNQREVGVDTRSFEVALKNAMREAPDVILIGEIRDEETMKHAIAYAETGHLALATLHANNANQALDRILNFFPEDARQHTLQDLSLNLRAVISQRLCLDAEGGRVAAVELMPNTPYIGELIESGRIDELKDAMTRSSACKTFDQALYELAEAGKITEAEALRQADSRNNLALKFRLEKSGESKGYPIKSEFSLVKTAPFDCYHTFTIRPLKIEDSPNTRDDAREVLDTGIAHALKVKGLKQVKTDADVEVQYVFGVKDTKGLELSPMGEEDESFDQYEAETVEHAMLVVNIVDTRTKKPVYRLSASRQISEHQDSQENINREFVSMLSSFPAGQ